MCLYNYCQDFVHIDFGGDNDAVSGVPEFTDDIILSDCEINEYGCVQNI